MFWINVLLAFAVPSTLLIPGMGGSYLYNQNNKKVWPSLKTLLWSPAEMEIVCSTDGCIPASWPAPIGIPDSILMDDWLTGSVYSRLWDVLHDPVAIPYDFRLLMDPGYTERLYTDLDLFLERGAPRVVFCHSLGGLMFHDYLISRPERARRVKRIVNINVPFDGSLAPFPFLFKKSNADNRLIINTLSHIQTLDHFGGFYWCLPWRAPDRTLFRLHGVEYTSASARDLFPPEMRRLYTKIEERKKLRIIPPMVHEVYNLCSTAAPPTPVFYDFDKGKHVYSDDGDGVATRASLNPGWGVSEFFPNTEHTAILRDKIFLEHCSQLARD